MDSTSTECIGRGAFGEVYLFVDPASRIKMVDKRVGSEHLTTGEMDAIEAEVNTMERFRHPCIIKLTGYQRTENVMHVYMAFMPEGSLSKLITDHRETRARIDETVVNRYLFQLLSALHYVHRQKLIHRNLKPSNVLLTDDKQRLKVTDFGAGASAAACNKQADLPVDVVYMAPEVIDELPCDYKCDIWSLGVIAYELIELQVPFQAENDDALYERIASGNMKKMRRAHVDAILTAMILKMLNVHSDQRPSCNTLLKLRLFEAMSCADETDHQISFQVSIHQVWQAAFDGDLVLLQALLVGNPTEAALFNGMHQSDGWLHCTTPLMAAASQGHQHIVRWLLNSEKVHINKGGVVLNYSEILKVGKTTALMVACRQGHVGVVEILVADGHADWQLCDDNGGTTLMWAAFGGKLEIMNMVPQEVEGNSKDSEQLTALHYATMMGREDVVADLLGRGMDVNARSVTMWSPMHLAAVNGHAAVIELLASHGAQIDARNSHRSTPLHIAASNGHVEAVNVLLSQRASKNRKDMQMWTPLHHAAKNGHAAVIDALIDHRADMEARTRALATPFHTAALHGRVEAIEALVKNGAEINSKDSDEWTPLHRAAFNGHTAAIEALIRAGADIQAQTSCGDTPFVFAKLNNHQEAAYLLRF